MNENFSGVFRRFLPLKQAGPHKAVLDLGSFSSDLWYGKRKLFRGRSLVAVAANSGQVVAVGDQAEGLQGKTGKSVRVLPVLTTVALHSQQVTDAFFTELAQTFKSSSQLLSQFVRIPLTVAYPYGMTALHQRVLEQAAAKAGFYPVRLIPKHQAVSNQLAATHGLENTAVAIVIVGGESTEIAVCTQQTLLIAGYARVGGEDVTRQIAAWLKSKHKLQVSLAEARQVKHILASRLAKSHGKSEELHQVVKGKDIQQHTPVARNIELTPLRASGLHVLEPITEAISLVFSEISANALTEIMNTGIFLTGGGAQTAGLVDHLRQTFGCPVALLPSSTVIQGLKVADVSD